MGSAFYAEWQIWPWARDPEFVTFSMIDGEHVAHGRHADCLEECPHLAARCGRLMSGNQGRFGVKGHVKRVLAEKGFGFITGDDRTDYFVHHSAIKNGRIEDLREGQPVEFEPTQGNKGPRAENVYAA